MKLSATQRIAKNFTWLSIGDILSRGINFFAIIYIARILGAAVFGLLNFAQAMLAYLILLVDSGLSLFGTREIARTRGHKGRLTLNIILIRLLIAAIVFGVSLAIIFSIPLSFELRMFFVGMFLFIFYRALDTDWIFQGLERMEYIAYSRTAYSALMFILIIVLVRTSGDYIRIPFIYLFCGMAVSFVFLSILFKYFTPASLGHLSPADWWEYFSEALPLGASAFLMQVYNNMDTIMLWFMDKPSVVGYYNVAYKVFFIFAGFLGLWQTTAFPVASKRIVQNKAKARKFLGKYVRLTLLAVIPLAFLVTLGSPLIIRVLFGVEYLLSSSALQILIWNLVIIAISGFYGGLILIAAGYSREYLMAVGGGAVLNIILNFILIPPFSYLGAAIATILTGIFVCAAVFLYSRKVFYLGFVKESLRPLLASFVSAAVFLVAFQGLSTFSYYIRLLVACLAFLTVYLAAIFYVEKGFLISFVREIAKIRRLSNS